MKPIKWIITNIILVIVLNNSLYAKEDLPQLFLFLGGDKVSLYKDKLNNPCVTGAQIIYSWRQLEPKKDVYDFSKIKDDLLYLNKIHKKIFIQLQDRSFEPTVINVPDYILKDKIYHGGVAMQYDNPGEGKPITTGWVARIWDPAVQARFQLLIEKLAREFDGKIDGINLPETAVDFDNDNLPEGYTHDTYYQAVIKNMLFIRKMFGESQVVQFVNFFPGEWENDHSYMSQLFSIAMANDIGLGGPDVVPYKKSHMQNSYPYFHQFKDKLFISMAIQEPDYTYTNPETGKPYSFNDFYTFVRDYLGADIIFWNVQEPFYSNQLVPKLNQEYFE